MKKHLLVIYDTDSDLQNLTVVDLEVYKELTEEKTTILHSDYGDFKLKTVNSAK